MDDTEDESSETNQSKETADSSDQMQETTYILEVPESIQVNKHDFEAFVETGEEEDFFVQVLSG